MATNALIVGAGRGISASFARTLAREGAKVMLASRSPEKVADIAAEIGAKAVQCDASNQASVAALFEAADSELGDLDLVLYNVSYRVRGPFLELDPAKVEKTLIVSAHGGFLVGQQAAKRMVALGFILFGFGQFRQPSRCRLDARQPLIEVERLGRRPFAVAPSRQLEVPQQHQQ